MWYIRRAMELKRPKGLMDVLDECWFVPARSGASRFPPAWEPRAALGSLSEEGLRDLAILHSMRTGAFSKPPIPEGEEDAWATTLLMGAVCEYYIDDLLLLPSEIRSARIREAAAAVGVGERDLVLFYLAWWCQYRLELSR